MVNLSFQNDDGSHEQTRGEQLVYCLIYIFSTGSNTVVNVSCQNDKDIHNETTGEQLCM